MGGGQRRTCKSHEPKSQKDCSCVLTVPFMGEGWSPSVWVGCGVREAFWEFHGTSMWRCSLPVAINGMSSFLM